MSKTFGSSVANVIGSLIVVLSSLGDAHAQPANFYGCQTPYTVWYINGVRAEPYLTELANLEILKAAAPKKAGGNQRDVLYTLLYNPSEDGALDLLQAAEQKFQQYTGFLSYADAFSVFFADGVLNSDIIKSLPLEIGAQLQQDAKAFKTETQQNSIKAYLASQPDLSAIMTKFKAMVGNSPAVLLGHSQGTLFANQVYDLLMLAGWDPSTVTTVGIAAVAPTMHGSLVGSSQYLTHFSDLLVFGVRQVDPLILPPNYFFGPLPDASDNLAHGFYTTYLRDVGLRAGVLNLITTSLNSLNSNCKPPTLDITVTGAQAGWTIPGVSQMTGFTQMSRINFPRLGTPGNSCGGEQGAPLYSQSDKIPQDADFFGPAAVLNPPFGFLVNRRPCSSFAAVKFFPDPSAPGDISKRKPRFWINLTARGQQFTDLNVIDRESQVRIDTGDPFTLKEYSCQAAVVANNFWFPQWSPQQCSASFEPLK